MGHFGRESLGRHVANVGPEGGLLSQIAYAVGQPIGYLFWGLDFHAVPRC
tara:strand:+ start:209 stop:358 length:150 start_codon:yes stop_codon:yes gene_type:complete